MMQRLAGALTRWAIRWVPDSFVIAILLTVVVFALTLAATPSTPLQVAQYWGDGLWELLSFGMQMCLVVLTGFVVAADQAAKWLVRLVDGQICPEVRRRYGRAAEMFDYELVMAVAEQVLAQRERLEWGLPELADTLMGSSPR